ncbi:HTH domain-containing protein [Virgibacillus alimentarius]|uniref:Helix-turn-helix type 11 domain-containing protein n=1 Tax=Virgibacillus alimentarius TaxID=698769 RepID=A0ABS4S8A5_9BACI|nr:HTH domain-containing protein [Virgibacillus alimentarius]MBP2257723.1 hypothetical protein [Virgibacillus alimentarius]
MISRRQAKIIEVLEESTNWITYSYLANKIGASAKTIQNEMKSLRKMLPSDWEIVRKRGKGIKLQKPSDMKLDILFQIEKDADIIHTIIDKIMKKNAYTIESLSEELFYTRQLLKEVEIVLDKHQLELKHNPLRIHGTELMKRILLFNLINDVRGEAPLFYTHYYKHMDCILNIKNRLKDMGIKIYPQSLIHALAFMKISIERYKEGHVIETPINKNHIKQQTIYKKITPLFALIEKEFHIKCREEERINLFFAFIYSDFYFLEVVETPEKVLKAIRHTPENYSLLIGFIQLLENNLNVRLLVNDNVVLAMYNLTKRMQLRNLNHLYQKIQGRSYSLKIKNQFQSLYSKLEKICDDWATINSLPPFTMDAISTLTLIIQRYQIENDQYKENIAYVYSETIELKSLAELVLKEHFNEHFTSIPLHKWEYNLHETFDLVLSDIPLNKSNDKFIVIEKIPTKQNIAVIRKKLEQSKRVVNFT